MVRCYPKYGVLSFAGMTFLSLLVFFFCFFVFVFVFVFVSVSVSVFLVSCFCFSFFFLPFFPILSYHYSQNDSSENYIAISFPSSPPPPPQFSLTPFPPEECVVQKKSTKN